MFLFHSTRMPGLGVLALSAILAGCASSGGSESSAGRIKVSSDPIGATVMADGNEIGTTPLEMAPASHFRSGFVGFSYRYTGKLTLKKAGCDTWSTEVNDYILSKDVHAKLKCDPNYRPVATPSAGTGSAPSVNPGEHAAERLERIEALRKKGLISDEEYKQLRMRVLEKL